MQASRVDPNKTELIFNYFTKIIASYETYDIGSRFLLIEFYSVWIFRLGTNCRDHGYKS